MKITRRYTFKALFLRVLILIYKYSQDIMLGSDYMPWQFAINSAKIAHIISPPLRRYVKMENT